MRVALILSPSERETLRFRESYILAQSHNTKQEFESQMSRFQCLPSLIYTVSHRMSRFPRKKKIKSVMK